MDAARLARARHALAAVHSLRVARARKVCDEATQACQVARRSHEQVRSMLDSGVNACARNQQQFRDAGTGRVRAEDLQLLLLRGNRLREIVAALERRVAIANKNLRRAEDAAQEARKALQQAIQQRDRVDQALEARVRCDRFARERRAEERTIDDMASRDGAVQ